jgi:predicted PurR-regulated permease PerM
MKNNEAMGATTMAKDQPTGVETTEPPAQLVAAQANSRQAWYRLWLQITSVDPRDLVRLLLIVGALALLGWVLVTFWSELLPFQVGVILAYLMLPIVNRLEGRMPRTAAVIVVIVGFLVILALVIAFLLPPLIRQLNTLLQLIPSTPQIEQWLTQLDDYIKTLPKDTQAFINDGIQSVIETLRNNVTSVIRNTISFTISTVLNILGTVTFLIGFVVIPFWLFFVLNDQEIAIKSLNKLLPDWLRTDFWAVIRLTDSIIGSYFRGQLLLASIIFVAVFIGLNGLRLAGVEGIQFVLLLSVFAGLMELIPIIGPILSAIPAITLGLFHSWESALIIGILFLIIQQLEGNLLVPRIVGNSVKIHPALVMMLVIILAPLGIAWLVVAVPMVAVGRDIYRYVYGRFSKPSRPAGLLPDEELPAADPAPGEPVAL